MSKILEVKNLNVYYKEKKHTKHALHDVTFSMEKGEILGLVGESGCGKTTLAKAILGFQRHFDGEIELDCPNPQMVFQDPYSSLNPAKTVGWILEEPLRMQHKYSKEERVAKVSEMLEKVGLDASYATRYPNELSGGQRQRISIACALIGGASFIIADEPVSALDVTIQAQIIRLLLKLHKEMGVSILFISHDLRVVYQMCDRVIIMESGEIVEQGLIEDIYKNPQHPFTKTLLEAADITGED